MSDVFPTFHILQFRVRDIHMENGRSCLNDWLEMTFSNREPVRICGSRRPRRVISGAGPANVTFASNESIDDFRGFWMIYSG